MKKNSFCGWPVSSSAVKAVQPKAEFLHSKATFCEDPEGPNTFVRPTGSHGRNESLW